MKKLLTLLILLITVFLFSCSNFNNATGSYHQAWLDEAVEHQGFTEYVYNFSETKGTVENVQILEIYGANSDEIYCKFMCYIEDDNEPEIMLLEKRVLELTALNTL